MPPHFSDIFKRRTFCISGVCPLRTSLTIFFLTLTAIVPLLAHAAEQTLEARRAELNRLLAEEWEYTLRTQPELATQVGDDRYNDRLSDFSDKAIADDLEHARQSLARFQAIDVTGFPEQEKLNRALMLRGLQETLDAAPFKDWEMPATQFGGIHLGYASLAFDSPFRNVKDYEDYVSRLHQIPRVFEQATAHMRDGLRDHLTPPKYLLEKVSTQAQQIADDSLDKSPFTEPLRKFPDSISEADRKRLRAEIGNAVKNEVAPAYAKFAKFVREDYAPHGRLDPGVWALPDGKARYRFAVRHQTTTDFTAEQIHQLGLKSVTEIEAQMLAIARGQGFSDLKSFNEHIRHDPKLYAKSGQQLFDLYTHYRDQMYAKLPELFGRLPKNKLDVVAMESFRSASTVLPPIIPSAPETARAQDASTSMNMRPRSAFCSTWKRSLTTRAFQDITCNFRLRRSSPACRRSANITSISMRIPKAGRSTLSAWEKRQGFIRIRTVNMGACRMKCGAPCAGSSIPEYIPSTGPASR